jgi:hypothetical protein
VRRLQRRLRIRSSSKKVILASFNNARNKAPEPGPSDIPVVEATFEAEAAADNTTGEAVAADGQSRRSKKSAGKKKRGARSSSARRQRSVDPSSEVDEGQAADDLIPDLEAEGVVQDWGWAFLFAIIADFIVIDALFMSVVTIITIKVGATPDACRRKREMWLKLVPPAIKESIE